MLLWWSIWPGAVRNSSVLTMWHGGGDWFLGFCCDLDPVGCCLLWMGCDLQVSKVGGCWSIGL